MKKFIALMIALLIAFPLALAEEGVFDDRSHVSYSELSEKTAETSIDNHNKVLGRTTSNYRRRYQRAGLGRSITRGRTTITPQINRENYISSDRASRTAAALADRTRQIRGRRAPAANVKKVGEYIPYAEQQKKTAENVLNSRYYRTYRQNKDSKTRREERRIAREEAIKNARANLRNAYGRRDAATATSARNWRVR